MTKYHLRTLTLEYDGEMLIDSSVMGYDCECFNACDETLL